MNTIARSLFVRIPSTTLALLLAPIFLISLNAQETQPTTNTNTTNETPTPPPAIALPTVTPLPFVAAPTPSSKEHPTASPLSQGTEKLPTPAASASPEALATTSPTASPIITPTSTPTGTPSVTPAPSVTPTSSPSSLVTPTPEATHDLTKDALPSSKLESSTTNSTTGNNAHKAVPKTTQHASSLREDLKDDIDDLDDQLSELLTSSKASSDDSSATTKATPTPSIPPSLAKLLKETADTTDTSTNARTSSSLSGFKKATASPLPPLSKLTSSSSPTAKGDDKVTVQFPHTSILEVLSLYEKLTGKRIIRDSNLAGPELSIMLADPVPKKDAIAHLESSMLLNGYVLVPVDEKTVKIMGPGRPPRTEGIPLYTVESDIPKNGEQLVSFYQPLHFLSPNEAITIIQGVVQINPYGSLAAVPNTSAIVLTDKTPINHKVLALLDIIDHEPTQIVTEFIPLQRADAEKMVETLNQIVENKAGTSSTTPSKPTMPTQPSMNGSGAITQGSDDQRLLSGKVQFIPDKRTNRILLITRTENYRYLRDLIAKLDQATHTEEPLIRPLNYMSETDIFPVLVDMLKNKDDESKQTGTNSQATPQSAFKNNSNNGSSSGTDGSSTGSGSHADRLNDKAPAAPPQSAIIGSTSLIGDPTANSIIVYGPPENKAKAAQIINILDQRPKQVYLAAVIGEMKLENGMDFGSSYLFHYNGFNTLANGFSSTVIPSSLADAGNILHGTTAATVNTLNNTGQGLTVFGSIGNTLDVYAQFLEDTKRFRTIARPVVYTSNNQKATIFSGQKVPYNSQTLTSQVAGGTAAQTANNITANVTYQDVLLKLEVIPLINSDNEVNLIISQQNQSIDTLATAASAASTNNSIAAPTINTQELTTSVRVPSGSTIVLGGLIKDSKSEENKGIPGLSKIPIIGGLLGSHTANARERRELIIMIEPVVIDSNASMEKASATQGANTDLGVRSKNLKQKLQPTPTPTPKKKKFELFKMPKIGNF